MAIKLSILIFIHGMISFYIGSDTVISPGVGAVIQLINVIVAIVILCLIIK